MNYLNFEKTEEEIENKEFEKSIESEEEEGDTCFDNTELKRDFFMSFLKSKDKYVPEQNFGDEPIKRYSNLVDLYHLQSNNCHEKKENLKGIRIKCKFIEENFKSYPIFKGFEFLGKKKKNNSQTPPDKYKCPFCTESFKKPQSLGGHNKLHKNFRNNDNVSLSVKKLLEELKQPSTILDDIPKIRDIVKKNKPRYLKIMEEIKKEERIEYI